MLTPGSEDKCMFWQAIMFLDEVGKGLRKTTCKPKTHVTKDFWNYEDDTDDPCKGTGIGISVTTTTKADAGDDLGIDVYYWVSAPGNHWTDKTWFVDLDGAANAVLQALRQEFSEDGAEFHVCEAEDEYSMGLPWLFGQDASDKDVASAAHQFATRLARALKTASSAT